MDAHYYSQKPCRNETAWKKTADGVIIIRAHSFQLVSLAPLGMDIYRMCGGETSISEILHDLKSKYPGIPGRLLEDELHRFLHYMQFMGALVIYRDNF